MSPPRRTYFPCPMPPTCLAGGSLLLAPSARARGPVRGTPLPSYVRRGRASKEERATLRARRAAPVDGPVLSIYFSFMLVRSRLSFTYPCVCAVQWYLLQPVLLYKKMRCNTCQ